MSCHAPFRLFPASLLPSCSRFNSTIPIPRPLTPTTEPRDPRKPPLNYTQRTTTHARRPDARLTPYPKFPSPTNSRGRGPPPPVRATRLHQKRMFVPNSPLPMPWLGRAPPGTKPYDPQDPPIFHVGRTGSQNLPVYVEKAGTPNLRVAVRRVSGSKPALARALAAAFEFAPEKVVAHPTSAQVLIRVSVVFVTPRDKLETRSVSELC